MADRRKDQLQREAARQRRLCEDWLVQRMVPDQPKWATKAEFREAAIAELGVSKTSFDAAWVLAIERLGRQDWYEPLRRRSRGASN